jgi:hypothetical protein
MLYNNNKKLANDNLQLLSADSVRLWPKSVILSDYLKIKIKIKINSFEFYCKLLKARRWG